MKFRITSFDMIEPSLSVLLFPMYFVVSIRQKKPKQTFKFCNGTPTSITDVAKILSHFPLWKVCGRLNLNFCTWFFSLLERGFLFKFIFFVCSFYTRHFFFASGSRTFNMDETNSTIFRGSIYLFILQANAINQVTIHMYY